MQTKAAKRYAAALFANARQHNQSAATLSQLEKLTALWQANAEIREVMGSPKVKGSSKAGILKAIGSKLELMPSLVNLSYLLLDKGRLAMLPALCQEYEFLEDRALGQVRASCVSAQPLTEQELAQLRQSLTKLSGAAAVLLSVTLDPSLLAGFVVNIDGKLIDGSLKGRLHRIKSSLAR